MSDIFSQLVEVNLFAPDDFLKIMETLTRIGIASKTEKKLTQTCHILHRQGRYYIVHFLEMFMIDGKGKNYSEEDRLRRNTIASLLEEWGLVEIVNPAMVENKASMKTIRVIPFSEKKDWILTNKYSVGVQR